MSTPEANTDSTGALPSQGEFFVPPSQPKSKTREVGLDNVLVVMGNNEEVGDVPHYLRTGGFDESGVSVETISPEGDAVAQTRSRLESLLAENRAVAVVMDCASAYQRGVLQEVLDVVEQTGKPVRRFVVTQGHTHGDVKRMQKQYGPEAYDEDGKSTRSCRHIRGSEGGHYSPLQTLWRSFRRMDRGSF